MGDAQPTIAQPTVAQRESMLRRVAVVLSSLPAPTATKLLSSISSQARHVVHQAVATLPPIDASEREQVVNSFANRIRSDVSARIMSTVAHPSGVQDEIVIGQSTTNIDHHDSAHLRSFGQLGSFDSSAAQSADESPFAFLDDTSTESLVELLRGEHPQTIALVLASISPKQAAVVLPELDPQLQTETLSRIGRLDEVHEETVAELADHLKNQLEERTSAESISSGTRALQAIIAQLPDLAQHSQSIQPTKTDDLTKVQQETHELRIAPGTLPNDSIEPSSTGSTEHAKFSVHDPDNLVADTAQPSSAVDNKMVQSYLVDMSPQQLVTALGQVSTRAAFLTLCGLPNRTSERAIAALPRAKAKTVRRAMAQLSDLQLCEIDDAIQAVAKVAFQIESSKTKQAA